MRYREEDCRPMPAKDFGIKFVCFKCSTKFYDMKKPDPICPKCGSDQRESPALKAPTESRRGRLAAVPKVAEPVVEPDLPAPEEEAEEDLETFEEPESEAELQEEDDL